ncbi:MAG: DUF3368 domain-containing protein [Phormidesmis sp.]
MIVVSDTSPLCYLVLIELVDVLPQMYGKVSIPREVGVELSSKKAPISVQKWIARPPSWLEIRSVENVQIPDALNELDDGEKEAIALAELLEATLILVDDRAARAVAEDRGFEIVGSIGVLRDASRAGLIDLEIALKRLQQTNFRVSMQIVEALLASE